MNPRRHVTGLLIFVSVLASAVGASQSAEAEPRRLYLGGGVGTARALIFPNTDATPLASEALWEGHLGYVGKSGVGVALTLTTTARFRYLNTGGARTTFDGAPADLSLVYFLPIDAYGVDVGFAAGPSASIVSTSTGDQSGGTIALAGHIRASVHKEAVVGLGPFVAIEMRAYDSSRSGVGAFAGLEWAWRPH